MSATRADRTAIRRTSLSRPVARALQDNLIHPERTFFDYGCGRGDDLLRLQKMGLAVSGWDPAFFPDEERTPADVVNLGYVVNVIEDSDDRLVVLAVDRACRRAPVGKLLPDALYVLRRRALRPDRDLESAVRAVRGRAHAREAPNRLRHGGDRQPSTERCQTEG